MKVKFFKKSTKTLKVTQTLQSATATNASNKAGKKLMVYNLIVLDESGSMAGVCRQTISGCNETLATIRNAQQKNDAKQEHRVSIYCFDSEHSRYLIEDESIDHVSDITESDYCPNACTPLYDALGFTLSRLEKQMDETDGIAVVTIITDGEENSSQTFTYAQIKSMIQHLKERGVVFTFIGANIDAADVAASLNIESSMQFEQTEEGMREMFCRENASRNHFYSSLAEEQERRSHLSEEERRREYQALNSHYFEEGNAERITPAKIDQLPSNGIFVFGANKDGIHNGGAARVAYECFGAKWGVAFGPEGQTFALTTVGTGSHELQRQILELISFIRKNPDKTFYITEIGCGHAGYTPRQVAPLFARVADLPNVYLPLSFRKVIGK